MYLHICGSVVSAMKARSWLRNLTSPASAWAAGPAPVFGDPGAEMRLHQAGHTVPVAEHWYRAFGDYKDIFF